MSIVNYSIEIMPIGDSRTQLSINNSTMNPNISNYAIDNLSINYNILSLQNNTAVVTLLDLYACRSPLGMSNVNNEIKKGDVIQIYEDNGINQILVFIGYINVVNYLTSIGNDYITLQCYYLLQQLSAQNIIKPITSASQLNSDRNHELTQFLAPNVSTLENTLSIIFEGTLIQYAYEQQYIDSITGITNKNNPYAFINASGALKGALSLTDKVIIPLSPSMKKSVALLNMLQIYQYIYYQDQYGVVRIQPLSTNNQADVIYNFTLSKDNSNYTPYESVLIGNHITLNQVIVTAVNMGAIDLELSSVASVKSGIFQREYDLLQTGNFTNLSIDNQNLPTEITQNSTALNIWYNTDGKGNPYINTDNSIVQSTKLINGSKPVNQVMQLIASRDLCQSLVDDTTITVNTKRNLSVCSELPFGKMINFDSAGRTDDNFDQGLCISCSLKFATGESSISYQIVKPFTITAIWDEVLNG